MLIDFVPTTNGLSLAEASAFKKAPGGAPANVAVGIARLGGSSAFIGKVSFELYSFDLLVVLYLYSLRIIEYSLDILWFIFYLLYTLSSFLLHFILYPFCVIVLYIYWCHYTM